MMTASFIGEAWSRYRLLAVMGYLALLVGLWIASWMAIANVFERRAEMLAATELLEQAEGRRPRPANIEPARSGAPAGSPFLEGETITVAGAVLQQRVSEMVIKLAGSVSSSQVDLQTQAKEGFINLLASCELEQPALQQLLYDLEAGMPFLFIDQLIVQAPMASATERQGGRTRVLLGVSAQWWQPAK